MMAPFVNCDGGRSAAGFKGETGDCVPRAVSIFRARHWAPSRMADTYREAMGESMALVIAADNKRVKTEGAHPGVDVDILPALLAHYALREVRLGEVSVTAGRLATLIPDCVLLVPGHVTAVVGGRVHDSWDPRRRKVRGCWVDIGDGREARRVINSLKKEQR